MRALIGTNIAVSRDPPRSSCTSAREKNLNLMAAGRGGYYGSLHPAYDRFHELGSQTSFSTDPSAFSGARNLPSPQTGSTNAKLDEILVLLRDQEEKISTPKSEVF